MLGDSDLIDDENPVLISIEYNPDEFDPAAFEAGALQLVSRADVNSPWVADITLEIVSIDYENNTITFYSPHLTGFGLGSAVSSALGGGGGSSGCFIATAAYGSPF